MADARAAELGPWLDLVAVRGEGRGGGDAGDGGGADTGAVEEVFVAFKKLHSLSA